MIDWRKQAEIYDVRFKPKKSKQFTMKHYYTLMDLVFTLISFYYLFNIQITNALICWGISEIYSLQRKQYEKTHP